MILNTVLRTSCTHCLRTIPKPALQKLVVIPDDDVLKNVSEEVYKPRKHPGIMGNKTVTIPDAFVKSVLNTIEDYPIKSIIEAGQKMARHLEGKVPPMEKSELSETVSKIQQRVLKKHAEVNIENADDERRFRQMVKDNVNNILREKIYNWRPIKYDVFNSLAYLLVRAPAEYAVLTRIFGEIALRDKEFRPRSLFDFGSGVGTVTWAANAFWKKNIFEYFNVDASADMNDLAQILLQGGRGSGNPTVKGTFYRQFLPASNAEYDLVTSAYSLMELPSLETRLQAVLNLWNKTQNYLVIVEHGTNAGFKVVNEARDFILQIDKEANVGHVFSPCPHDSICPRFLADDGTPCNFMVQYMSMPIGGKSSIFKERYSYVVLKKGSRREDDLNWPRIVRPTLIRSKHTICRICSANGKLDEIIFTAKKHGKTTYHCARSSKWGDLLPVTTTESKQNPLDNPTDFTSNNDSQESE